MCEISLSIILRPFFFAWNFFFDMRLMCIASLFRPKYQDGSGIKPSMANNPPKIQSLVILANFTPWSALFNRQSETVKANCLLRKSCCQSLKFLSLLLEFTWKWILLFQNSSSQFIHMYLWYFAESHFLSYVLIPLFFVSYILSQWLLAKVNLFILFLFFMQAYFFFFCFKDFFNQSIM